MTGSTGAADAAEAADAAGAAVQRALAAIAEPTRFRIVSLLASRACTVGEVQQAIGALQPQTSKHLQALEAAGVVRVHRLGRRRVARIDRDAMAALSAYFGELAAPHADDSDLDAYELAVRVEESRKEGEARTLRFTRMLAAPPEAVWAAWTDPSTASHWWAPASFVVEEFTITPEPGGLIRFALREGDGARYLSAGVVEAAESPSELTFSLAPADDTGLPLFDARHSLTLSGTDETELTLTIDVSAVRPEAASAVAGLEPGWTHLLDSLATVLAAGPHPRP